MPRLQLGTAFGIGIFVHWSFLLLPALIFWLSYHDGDLGLAVFRVLQLLAVFGCVVLHELGHALMARHFDIGTRDITIYPIGGIARLERMSEKPWEEFFIAVAGPAVNVVIAALLVLVVLPIVLLAGADLVTETIWGEFLLELLLANLVLVAFNLIPAFPMDGGRVLRSLLATCVDYLRATEVAVAVSGVLAALMIAAGVGLPLLAVRMGVASNVLQGPWTLGLLGLFVLFLGQQELYGVRRRLAARAQTVAEVEPEILDVLPYQAEASPEPPEQDPSFTGLAWDVHRRAWVIWQNGRVVSTYGARPE